MPYAQPADMDQLFLSDFTISFIGNGDTGVQTVVGPIGAALTLTTTGIYNLALSTAYTGAVTITNATFLTGVAASATSTNGKGLRHITGTSTTGSYNFESYAMGTLATTPLSLSTLDTGYIQCQFRFSSPVQFPNT